MASDIKNEVFLSRCGSYRYSEIKQALVRSGEALPGGWASAVPPGAKVLLKPNLLKAALPEQQVSPHPSVVRAVAEICRDSGAAEILIGDSPGFGSAGKVAEKCGIMDVARELDLKVVEFTESVCISTPEHFLHRHFSVARDLVAADVVINLPKFKTHAMMVLTLAVKNLYGALVGKQKGRWHFQSGRNYDHFARLLVELAYAIRPAVSVLDAVVGMEGNGPGSGTPRKLGFLAVSSDMVSLDRVAVEIAGIDPERVYTLRAARKIGLETSLDRIRVSGEEIDALRVRDLKMAAHMSVEGPAYLKPLSWVIRRFVTTKPWVRESACKRCGICVKACPAGSIRQLAESGPAAIDHHTCIRCFCCQELCPEGAISVRDSIGVKLLQALGME